ncbi:MAG: glycosyltransferase family 39 protein [Isosphaeraceae bacterium]|nr:glycosyltransferase family 39 protein [Isosphaeraceae bacterium]
MKRHLLLVAIVALASFLRLFGLGAKTLWLDEVLSWRLLQFPVTEMVSRTGGTGTVHPPLYFLLLRTWVTVWGDSEVALRLLSACCGVITVIGIYVLLLELMSLSDPAKDPGLSSGRKRTTALLATTLVALSPLQVHMARQTRGYSLATALFVWGSWLLVRALRSKGRQAGYWIGFGVCTLALCYTHYVALLSAVSQGLFVLLYLLWPPRAVDEGPTSPDGTPITDRTWLTGKVTWAGGVLLAVTIGFLSWLPALVNQTSTVSGGSWQPPLSATRVAIETYISLFSTFANRASINLTYAWLATALVAAAMLVLLTRHGWGERFLALTGLMPALLMLLYSSAAHPNLYYSRYLTFVQLAWLAGLAILVTHIPNRYYRRAWAAALLAGSVYGCYASWDEIGSHANPGMRGAMAYVRAHGADDEPIVTMHGTTFLESLYYSRQSRKPYFLMAEAPAVGSIQKSAHLKLDDFISARVLASRKCRGIWLVFRDGEKVQGRLATFLPYPITRVTSKSFLQDYRWEGSSVVVEHYRPGKSSEFPELAATRGPEP